MWNARQGNYNDKNVLKIILFFRLDIENKKEELRQLVG